MQVDPNHKVGSLREVILRHNKNFSQSLLGIELLLGQGGRKLLDANVALRDTGVEDGSTIVVVQITHDVYLARQKEAVRALYNLLPDGLEKHAALARLEDDPDTWLGVKEKNVSPEGFILKLNLSFKQLAGAIPRELGHLTKLQTLDLSRNQLRGEIPGELGHLTELQMLYLSQNQLTGLIPRELGQLTKLRLLDLHENQLTGEIPGELKQLTTLQFLLLYGNELTGEIQSLTERGVIVSR